MSRLQVWLCLSMAGLLYWGVVHGLAVSGIHHFAGPVWFGGGALLMHWFTNRNAGVVLGAEGSPKGDPDEAFRQYQRDRIAEAYRFDAEQRMCLTCAANHYCERHNPAPKDGVNACEALIELIGEFGRCVRDEPTKAGVVLHEIHRRIDAISVHNQKLASRGGKPE